MIFLYIMLGGLVSFCFSPFLVKALQAPFVYFLYMLQGSPFGFFLSLIYCFFCISKKKNFLTLRYCDHYNPYKGR